MADKNKRKLKVKWYDALNPLKIAGGALRLYKQEIKKKRAKEQQQNTNTNTNTNTNNNNKNTKTNTNNKVIVKSNKKTDYNVATESGKKAYEAAIAKNKDKNKPKKKRLTAREKLRVKNEARFGKAHVDKLRAKNADFKKMKRGEMSKKEFTDKYKKSITAQRAQGLRK